MKWSRQQHNTTHGGIKMKRRVKLLHLLALLDKNTHIIIYSEDRQCVIFNAHVEDIPVDICVTRYFVTDILLQQNDTVPYLTISVRE